jgi:hypothetical protein
MDLGGTMMPRTGWGGITEPGRRGADREPSGRRLEGEEGSAAGSPLLDDQQVERYR